MTRRISTRTVPDGTADGMDQLRSNTPQTYRGNDPSGPTPSASTRSAMRWPARWPTPISDPPVPTSVRRAPGATTDPPVLS